MTWLTDMILEQLLGGVSPAAFMEDYFLKLPFSMPGGAAAFTELGTWTTIESILSSPDPDVLVVKQGRQWEEGRMPSAADARSLHEEGYTLLVRHAERHEPRLAELAAGFGHDFHAPVDVHLYCTPGREWGFGWHYDAEDVFILQTAGSKEYSLRKNTVNPWPLAESLPRDMKYEREIMPLMKCLLHAGDWLYIPHGYWHMAAAKEPSISLAVGLQMPAAIDVFDFLRPHLLESLRWRQRLPATGAASPSSRDEQRQQFRTLFAELADDLAAMLRDERTIEAFWESLGHEVR